MSEKCGILVVDDDSFVGEMLAFILEEDGYRVETAENGEDALTKFSGSTDFDLVLSDLNMPDMSGLELMAKIKAGNPEVAFIILTGSDELAVAADALKNGADGYLVKDENIQDTVAAAVDNVMRKRC